MKALDQREREFYFAQQYSAVPIKDIDALIKKYNDFYYTYFYQKYYLQHLICTDQNIKTMYESLLEEAEKICSGGNNPVTQYVLAQIYEYKIDRSFQKKALDMYLAGAEAGFGRSMVAAGHMLELGTACATDEKRAFDLYTKAVATGYIEAKAELGRMYILGGAYVQKSVLTAFDLFKESYCGGENYVAVIGLARCFIDSDWEKSGYKKNPEEAERLLKPIAEINLTAMLDIGYINKWYLKSLTTAIYYYEKAADKGDGLAAKWLSQIYAGDTKMTASVKSYNMEQYWKNRYSELEMIRRNIEQSVSESEYLAKLDAEKAASKGAWPLSCLYILILGVIIILLIIFGFNLLGDLLTFIFSLPMKIIEAIKG